MNTREDSHIWKIPRPSISRRPVVPYSLVVESISLKEKSARELRDYVAVDPEVSHGRACIADTRDLVNIELYNLAIRQGAGRNHEKLPSRRLAGKCPDDVVLHSGIDEGV